MEIAQNYQNIDNNVNDDYDSQISMRAENVFSLDTAREKYSNLVDTEILKTRNLDDESTTIESVKQMNNLSLDCVIIFGGDGTARLVANYINHTPILAISTGTNNLFPENIDGTIAGIAVGKFINSENRKNYLLRHKKLEYGTTVGQCIIFIKNILI